jgi:hypothetical protein
VKERNPLSLRAQPRLLVDEAHAGLTATLQGAIQVIHRKADVVNARAPLFEELSDRRVGFICFEKLDQGLPGMESANAGPVAVGQLSLRHSEDIAIE